MANFKIQSRYTNGIKTKDRSDKDFLVLRQPLNLVEDAGDVFVTITKDIANRPDLISYKAYNTIDLWWVIYEFNGIKDPLFEMVEGKIIRIPEKNRVLKAISEMNKI